VESDDLEFYITAQALDDSLCAIGDRPSLAMEAGDNTVNRLNRLRTLKPEHADKVLIQFYAWVYEYLPRFLASDPAQVPNFQYILRRVSAEVGPYPAD
jgi:hypothetical protein